MKKIVLNEEESQWLEKNIKKTLTILAAKGDDSTSFKHLKTLEKWATEEKTPVIDVQDKVVFTVSKLIDNTLNILENTILPEYKKRNLELYASDTTRKISMLKAMRRKFKC